jgi:hypothetical protein
MVNLCAFLGALIDELSPFRGRQFNESAMGGTGGDGR